MNNNSSFATAYPLDWPTGWKRTPALERQVTLVAPLRDRTYQRHDVGKWVLVKSGEGFA